MSKFEAPTKGGIGVGPAKLKPVTKHKPIKHGSPAPITKRKGG